MLSVCAACVAGVRALTRKRSPVSTTHLRGRTFRSSSDVAVSLATSIEPGHPSLQLGRLKLPARLANGHIAFVGATGSGKTILQRLLMQSVLPRIGTGANTRALVYDAKQDALSVLAGLNLTCPVHIMNPLDSRSVAWDMAKDITSPAAALQAATLLIPDSKNDSSPFFAQAARHLLTGVLISFIQTAGGEWTLRQVLLVLRDPKFLRSVLERTEATRHLLQYFEHPGTFQNIISTILTHTAPFEIIAAAWDRAGGKLSLRDWLTEESILLLGNDEENRAAIDTINRLLFQRLSELLLSQQENDLKNPRVHWLFLDEVREAGRLDGLSRVLTKGRSKGVAVVLGFQDVNGLRHLYGREVADELLGQCNTKIILRLNSPETAEWASKSHGKREVVERSLGRSQNRNFRGLGLNSGGSSGSSESNGIAERAVVLDSEFLDLPETTKETGLSAYFLSPLTGAFRDNIPGAWIDGALMPVDPDVPNVISRPEIQQYLRPWDESDEATICLCRPRPVAVGECGS